MNHQTQVSSVVALDVGEKRIGVAQANIPALLAHPLTTLTNSDQILHDLVALLQEQRVVALVVGLPRGLNGQETAQTRAIEAFGLKLEEHVHIPLYWQDEAVTSRQAEEELKGRGKPYEKGDIDALAATYILEDFLHEHRETFA